MTKILLDECVLPNLKNTKIIDPNAIYHCSVQLIGQGASDDQVMQFARDNDYLLVTQDNRFVIKCIANGVRVAYFEARTNKAHVVNVPALIDVPLRLTKGAPIKVKVEKMQKPSLFARLKIVLSSKN
jgi:predicted nuclease of predicted toxin-antitoxin system